VTTLLTYSTETNYEWPLHWITLLHGFFICLSYLLYIEECILATQGSTLVPFCQYPAWNPRVRIPFNPWQGVCGGAQRWLLGSTPVHACLRSINSTEVDRFNLIGHHCGLLLTTDKYFDLTSILPAIYIANNRFACPHHLWFCFHCRLY